MKYIRFAELVDDFFGVVSFFGMVQISSMVVLPL